MKRGDSGSLKESSSFHLRVPSFDDDELHAFYMKYKHKKDKGVIPFENIYRDITEKGIRLFHDVRLAASVKELPKYSDVINPNAINLTSDIFRKFMTASRSLIVDTLEGRLIIPNFEEKTKNAEFLFEACKFEDSGKPSLVVPHLKKMDPNIWEMCVCSKDGQIYSTSPTEKLQPFPIMGICKLILYAMAIELLGSETVHAYVGQQTTRMSHFEREIIPKSERFQNRPMHVGMEGGAIVLCSLLINVCLKDLSNFLKYDYIYNYVKKLAGSSYVGLDKSIFVSMMDNSSEYFGLCYYLESSKCFRWEHDIKKDLEFYFQMCSFELNCESLSIIGATLANFGVNPFTKERIISNTNCQLVLSYMQIFSTGTGTAHWIRKVCLPIAFGESGGCLVVVPGLISFGFISPKINKYRISTRAYVFIKGVAIQCGLHPFDNFEEHVDKDNEDDHICLIACPMFKAALEGSCYHMAQSIQRGIKPCTTNYVNRTILHYAAVGGKLDCVKFIAKLCPYLVDMTDIMGNTASAAAAVFGHKDIAEFLSGLECIEKT